MFNSVVIATDIDAGSDRAIPVGTALAHRGRLPVEVLTVVSEPSARSTMRGDATQWRTGSVTPCVVVHGDDIAAAIVDQLRDRDGALLVMTTSATGLVSQRRGSVSAHVLSERVSRYCSSARPYPTRASVVDHAGCLHRPFPRQWGCAAGDRLVAGTFGGGRPWVVEVIATSAWPADTIEEEVEREQVDACAAVLADTASTPPECSTAVTP